MRIKAKAGGLRMKWGIIATGRIAKKFAQTINSMNGEGEILLAVASRDLSKAETFAKDHSIPKFYGSYEELAEDPEIEAVYIATPNNLHYENTLLCLNSKKHVLCEKPFTLDFKQAEELYSIAKKNNLFLMEGFWIAMIPGLMQMKKWINEGKAGTLEYARVDYGFALAPERRYRKFAPELGGGALWDIGVYNLGFLRMVAGTDPQSFSVHAHKNEYGTDDYSTVELCYENGFKAVALTSIGIDLGRRAMIQGSKGIIVLEDFQHAQKISFIDFSGNVEEETYPFEINGFEYQVREMSSNIKNGRTSSLIHTPEASCKTIKLIQEILGKI